MNQYNNLLIITRANDHVPNIGTFAKNDSYNARRLMLSTINMRLKVFRSIAHNLHSVFALIVAVRGQLYIKAISPNALPGPRVATISDA